MKTKNIDLVNILLSSIAPNLLVDSLAIVGKLLKQYGKMLYTQQYIKQVSHVDQNIGNLISILDYTDKKDYNDIKKLILMVKSYASDYRPEFNIVSDSNAHNEKLKAYIQDKFENPKINVHTYGDSSSHNDIGISVSGEGRYYKKSLNSDLEKILH